MSRSSHSDSGSLSYPDNADAGEQKTAVIYLRVSTARQARKGGEAEGFSIPAQRAACIRKAGELGAVVVEEFVDAGASARSADRAALQDMLVRLQQGDIDLVVIHKIDRLARDRGDDVQIMMAIHKAGATLVSVTENIDDTPAGKLMHGMLATFSEFYSSNLSHEAKKGLQEKVRRGGTPGYAPLGYVNVSRIVDGFEVKSVEPDPDRAPHIQWAFGTYATGDWSISALRDALEERGMKSRKTKTQVGTPLSGAQVHRILQHPYYKGLVRFNGVLYDGNHEPLVDQVTWQRVQDVLSSRRIAGDRSWRHSHYLKGSLRCARCKGRMSYGHSRGRGGVYSYFFCLGRHTGRTDCDLPYVNVEQLERQVQALWKQTRFTATFVDRVRQRILEELDHTDADNQKLLATQRRRLTQLKRQNEKLLDAYMADAITVEDLKERQQLIQAELASAKQLIDEAEQDIELVHDRIEIILALLHHGSAIYGAVDDIGRQLLNEAMYEAFYVDMRPDDDRGGFTGFLAAAPHTEAVEVAIRSGAHQGYSGAHTAAQGDTAGQDGPAAGLDGAGTQNTPGKLSLAGGSNVHHLAAAAGFEHFRPDLRFYGVSVVSRLNRLGGEFETPYDSAECRVIDERSR